MTAKDFLTGLPNKVPDGVPSIENSSVNRHKQYSTSKFLLNDEEDDERMSNISEIILNEDKYKFIRLYNI